MITTTTTPTTAESSNDIVKFEKIRENFEWFYENYEDLKQNFSNRYVAVKDRRQIDSDKKLEVLLKRLNLSNCDESIAIEYVNI
jgi:phage anti-repressor protein